MLNIYNNNLFNLKSTYEIKNNSDTYIYTKQIFFIHLLCSKKRLINFTNCKSTFYNITLIFIIFLYKLYFNKLVVNKI